MNGYENSTLPRLFETMEERKITAKQVSEGTGVSASSITAWRNGTRKPKYEAIQSISTYLDVPVEYLTGSNDTVNEVNSICAQHYSKTDISIQSELCQLSEGQKQEILDYVRYVKSKEK